MVDESWPFRFIDELFQHAWVVPCQIIIFYWIRQLVVVLRVRYSFLGSDCVVHKLIVEHESGHRYASKLVEHLVYMFLSLIDAILNALLYLLPHFDLRQRLRKALLTVTYVIDVALFWSGSATFICAILVVLVQLPSQ